MKHDRLTMARNALPAQLRPPEPACLAELLAGARLDEPSRARVVQRATALVDCIRNHQGGGWVERFLQEYRLDSSEGKALLTLAEAFLRVPDAGTADALIRDKLVSADWKAHAGKSDSTLVNSATFGLMMAQLTVGADANAGLLRRIVARSGEPFVRTAVQAAMRMMGEQFVTGRTIDEALDRAASRDCAAYRFSFDMLGEGARTADDAQGYFLSYVRAIAAVGARADAGGAIHARHSVSVKLSALHPRYEFAQADRCVPALTDQLAQLAVQAAGLGIGLTVDAEESERLEMSLDIIQRVRLMPALKGWTGFGMAVQAYQKRARAVVAWADALGAQAGTPIAVRLVKGAYWDSEIKRCQERGLADYPVFTRKAATDVSYLACARDMLASPNMYPAFASHNALTVATIIDWAGARRDFEFQRLHGMGESLYADLVAREGYACRVYAPVGGHRDLLAYLVRRLLENGANSSFVNQVADAHADLADVLEDPVAEVERHGLTPHPAIALPGQLFGASRTNSAGLDLNDAATVQAMLQATSAKAARWTTAAPCISGGLRKGTAMPVHNPADSEKSVGAVVEATMQDVADALGAAHAAQPAWAAAGMPARAACLARLADLLERDQADLIQLCVREAGKTLADALGEVREAIDFCRYYSVQARSLHTDTELPGPTGERNRLTLVPRGVIACISPWNFPLAIFIGQVAAALVTGNAVVAKPAPQTPLIAAAATELMFEAGVPTGVFHLLPGGSDIGAALVGDVRVSGVAFTGATSTARAIARALLDDPRRPLVPMVAETGGINAMIVDSTALPEQVVQDVLASAFQSAGQRCSALRLLCVQADVADGLLEMLRGAMAELRIGDPALITTDIGPVIDAAARDRLLAHRAAHGFADKPAGPGYFVPPTLIPLAGVADLTAEHFGPLLHVVRWTSGGLDALIDDINGLGYGLTLGVHSRLASVAEKVEARAQVGNLYINRSMIGAVVGSQPFGGQGLSGTGPKAGGPHYLMRFMTERVISQDTTAAGGNASLLAMAEV